MGNQTNTNVTRRSLLKGRHKVAGGMAVAVSGGLVYRATEKDMFSPFDGPAYEPWELWKTDPLSFPLITVQILQTLTTLSFGYLKSIRVSSRYSKTDIDICFSHGRCLDLCHP